VARSSEYFGSDLVIDPAVSRRAAGAVRRAYDRQALVEYGKTWERDERAFDLQSSIAVWITCALISVLWGYTYVATAFFLARGLSVGQVVSGFLVPGLILFGLATLALVPVLVPALVPARWKATVFLFAGGIVWPVTFPVLLIFLHRQWPHRRAERLHRRYVVPATDFDEAATAVWARAVETGAVLAGPAGSEAQAAVARSMWTIAELLARSSPPAEPDRRSALLDDAARQVDLLGTR
jgi:hypothetical protein